MKEKERENRINEEIRVAQVRLIDVAGKQVGVVATAEALRMAREAGVDLVEISPQASPPVCKLMNYSKYLYEAQKKAREARKKQHVQRLKEVKIRPRIGVHDYAFKKKHIIRFLERGDKVKVTVTFFGREMAYTEQGRALLRKVYQELGESCRLERDPLQEGRNLSIILLPK